MRRRDLAAMIVTVALAAVLGVGHAGDCSSVDQIAWQMPSVEETLAALDGLPFDEFVEAAYRQLLLHDPETITLHGLADELGVRNDRWTDHSEEGLAARTDLREALLERLMNFSTEALTDEESLTWDVFRRVLERDEEEHATLWPVFYDHYTSAHIHPFYVLLETHPLETARDVEDYLARMESLGELIDQCIEMEERRTAAGCPASWHVLNPVLTSVDRMTPLDWQSHELVEHLADKLPSVDELAEGDRALLLAEAERIARAIVVPAYERLMTKLWEWLDAAPRTIGIACCPAIEEAFRVLVSELPCGPPDEVSLLSAEMMGTIARFELRGQSIGKFGDFEGRILDDVADLKWDCASCGPDEAVEEYERLLIGSAKTCEHFFSTLPQSVPIVVLLETGSAVLGEERYLWSGATGTARIAVAPVQRNGLVDVSLDDVARLGYPGRHLQRATALELDLPLVRRLYTDSFSEEGWAAYAQDLVWREDGLDSDCWDDVRWWDEICARESCGKTDYELDLLNRATLAGLDVGIHALGWTRREAEQHVRDAFGGPVARYPMIVDVCARPGEHYGRWVGCSTYSALQSMAEDVLGERLGLLAFHDAVLRHGVLPIPLLWTTVQDDIKRMLED